MDAPTSTSDDWMRRIAAHLHELSPTIQDEEAAEVAHVAFHSASDVDLEDTAIIFSEILNAHVRVHDLKRWMRTQKTSLGRAALRHKPIRAFGTEQMSQREQA